MVREVMQKVVRRIAEIRYFVEFRTNLQLIVLKILMVVFCEGESFVGLFC